MNSAGARPTAGYGDRDEAGADPQALHHVSAHAERGSLLEAARKRLGRGPCVDSLVHDVVVSTHDLRVDDRWPGLAEALSGTDIVSVLGVPARIGGTAVGSLNASRAEALAWDPSEVRTVQSFARAVEDLIGAALPARDRDTLATQLQQALEQRVVVERAVGVLMGAQRVAAVTAFDVLRRQARADRRKVADVARDMPDALR